MVDVEMAEDHVGHGVEGAPQLLQPHGQEFPDSGHVPARHQLGGCPAAQIEDDTASAPVGGQESAERNLKHSVPVEDTGQAPPDGRRDVRVEQVRRHRYDAVGKGFDSHIAYPHASTVTIKVLVVN
jgi:hypothetical protein